MDDTWLCIPCMVKCLEYPDDAYHIFFVDVSGGIKEHELVGFLPQLRITHKFDFMTFWVEQSKLYMISHKSISVATVKLTEELLHSPFPVELNQSMITYVAPMNYPKQWPFILPTLDGKILAMSSAIQSHVVEESEFKSDVSLSCGKIVDFEIYDSSNDSWETLPSIQSFWPNHIYQHCSVMTAAFINPDTLFVKTSCMGNFLFLLSISEKTWRVSEKLVECYDYQGFDIKAIVNGELCFTSREVADINHMSRSASVCAHIRPFFEDLEDYKHERSSCLVSAVNGEKKTKFVKFYTVGIAREKRTKCAKFIVRGYWLDIDKYSEDKRVLESEWRNKMEKKKDKQKEKLLQLRQEYDKMGGERSLDEHIQRLQFKFDISLSKLRQKWERQPCINMKLTTSYPGLRVLCSLKLSSRKADCCLDSLSFFLAMPFSSSEPLSSPLFPLTVVEGSSSGIEPEELSLVSISALASGSTSYPGDGKRPRLC